MDYNSYNLVKSLYKMVPVRPETLERLKGYKMASATYDQILNELMDAVPIEKIARKVVREHRQRMRSRHWKDWREVRKKLGDD